MPDAQPTDAATERDQLRAALLDIDAHATPYGDIPDDPGWVGTYLVTAGALHRALGKVGHTAPSCAAEAELALLHEGEEPYIHEHTVATPAQWIWLWNRATPERRLEVATGVADACARSDRCFMGGHDARLERLGAAEAALGRGRAVLDRWARYTQLPQAMRALDEVRHALDGEEQPATGGTVDAARFFRQVGEGPVCDGNLLPRREPGAARAAVTLDHPAPDTPTLAAIVQALTEQAKQERGPGQ